MIMLVQQFDEHLDAEADRSAPTLTLMQQYEDHIDAEARPAHTLIDHVDTDSSMKTN